MEFKIDTKTSYTVVSPDECAIDANLSGKILDKCKELADSGSGNMIADLASVTGGDAAGLEKLLELHEYIYSNDRSLVFVNVPDSIMQILKENDWHHAINIAPTMIEAVDIISMEILERDIFNEEP